MHNKKKSKNAEISNVFIVGSPRSGTTLLGDILDLHPRIVRWYEPYFVLDHYFRYLPDDCRTKQHVTKKVKRYITKKFNCYKDKRDGDIIVDKSPRNSLKIPFLLEIFPDAKFIHIIRDGRDATLSIHKEWLKRKKILETMRGLRKWKHSFEVIRDHINRQPLFIHKLAALSFELVGLKNILKEKGFLHKSRWNGRIGWGPLIEDWQSVIDEVSLVEFNALQWKNCVEAVRKESEHLSISSFLEIRYENLIQHPESSLERIFSFLKVSCPEDFMSRLPALKHTNFNKWKNAFTEKEKAAIGPLIHPLLVKLKYADNTAWYK